MREIQDSSAKTFFGHPRGLATLFFTEFWERFSYYGMRAILIYYMYTAVVDGGLGFSQATATAIMSIYGSLVYMSGVIGGWTADRILGPRRTIFYGGVLIMLGHIALSFPGGATALFVSMFFIIIGTGFLKPNVSNVVGDLYPKGDQRRDAGFSIFYMGINLGAFIAPFIVTGVSNSANSYHAGFGVAAVGMAVGLIVYVITGKMYLRDAGKKVPNPLKSSEKKKMSGLVLALAAGIVAIGTIVAWLQGEFTLQTVIMTVTVMGVIIPLIYFIVMMTSKKTTKDERSRLTAYIPLFLISVMFWMIEEQGSTTLALFAANRTDLSVGSFTLDPGLFQSLNPMFIIILSPIFAWIWTKLGKRQPGTPRKFAMGLFFAGLSFVIMMLPGILAGNTTTAVSPMWLVLSFFICIVGEMCLSPVGLSATTKLAPAAFASQTMSVWFLSDAMAQAFNAQTTQYFNAKTEILYFGIFGFGAVAFAILLFLGAPLLKKYMRGVD
ncbi:peptide MFS transporter [Listeria grandensis]|uniref:Peptide MFS transporter n=1 Tax=Listeria grandensis TaxID=1494963 RepID=A0A7X0Y6I9_9LIST|nr:peptide MFS transporter [Listeria grandensis]MBC1475696.1 peptide MFS transporter [Listeria grandensis]MBC1937474.1 peptide MFS transporter [Listeria grandensis]